MQIPSIKILIQTVRELVGRLEVRLAWMMTIAAAQLGGAKLAYEELYEENRSLLYNGSARDIHKAAMDIVNRYKKRRELPEAQLKVELGKIRQAARDKAKGFVEQKSLNVLKQRQIDASFSKSTQAIRNAFGLPNPVTQPLTGVRANPLYQAARGFSSNALEAYLFPATRKQAFGSGFGSGVIGGTGSTLAEIAFSVIPSAIGKAPAISNFLKVAGAEARTFASQGLGSVNTATQLAKAVKVSATAGAQIFGGAKFLPEIVAGYVAGRVTTAIAKNFVFVSNKERVENAEQLQKTLPGAIDRTTTQFVESYVKSDGTKVASYQRQMPNTVYNGDSNTGKTLATIGAGAVSIGLGIASIMDIGPTSLGIKTVGKFATIGAKL